MTLDLIPVSRATPERWRHIYIWIAPKDDQDFKLEVTPLLRVCGIRQSKGGNGRRRHRGDAPVEDPMYRQGPILLFPVQ